MTVKIKATEEVFAKDVSAKTYAYEDVLKAIEWDVGGIKKLVSDEDITMQEVADIFEKNINFGTTHYEIASEKSDINTGKTSKDNVKLYKERYVKG